MPSLLSKFIVSIKTTFKRSSKRLRQRNTTKNADLPATQPVSTKRTFKKSKKPKNPNGYSAGALDDPGPVLVDRMNHDEMAQNHTIQALARAESETKIRQEDMGVHQSMLKDYHAFLQETRADLQ